MADRIVKVVLRGDVAGFKASMVAASRSVAATADQMTAADKRSREFRAGLTTMGATAGRIGLVAAAGLGFVAKAAMDWESAWTGVTKTVDGTATTSLPRLEAQLRSLTHELPATHAEIAGVAEAAGQLGVKADDVTSFTKTMIELGDTTNLSADEAATAIARFNNVMGIANSQADRVGSTLVDLGNNSATTEAEILTLGQRLSAAGKIAGLSAGDVLGFAATLTSVGVEAEAGGTAMSKVFTKMRDSVLDGGAELETFAQTAGMTASEFTRQWEDDPASAIEAFIAGLGRMNASGESTSQVFKALGLQDQRLMRALLSTASAGDLLTESVARGNRAWKQNTALSAEAEKRYGTTASQAKIAWNTIKDSAIDFGDAALPIIAKGAAGLAKLATVLGSVPAPAKSAGTALLGITAVTGGGFWLTSKAVTAVADTREALSQLGVSAGRTRGALKLLGGVAAPVAIFTALGEAADSLEKSLDRTVPGLEKVTASILDLTQKGDGRALARDLGNIAGALDRIKDPGFFNDLQSLYDKIPMIGHGLGSRVTSLLGGSEQKRELREAREAIEAIDSSLAAITASGHADQAKAALRELGEAYGLSAAQQKQLVKLLPQYGEALDGVSNSERLAKSATEGTAAAQQAQAQATAEQRKAALKTATAFVGLGDSLDDAKVSLGQWIKQLAGQARALEQFGANARRAADRGLRQGLIAALQEAGPAGAMRMQQLANASDREIARANRAWSRGQRAVKAYAGAIDDVPAKVGTSVNLDIHEAMSNARRIQDRLNAIRSKTVTVNIRERRGPAGKAAGLARGYASGGHTGYGPASEAAGVVHGREFVFSEPATRGNEAFLDGLHRTLRGYASGGTVAAAPGRISMPAQIAATFAGDELDALRAEVAGLRSDVREVVAAGAATIVSGGLAARNRGAAAIRTRGGQ